MRSFVFSAMAFCLASPVFALSCLPGDPVTSFKQALESEEAYVVVEGSITLTSDVIDYGKATHGGKLGARTTAFVEGTSLTMDGFVAPFSSDIAIWTSCVSEWCGAVPQEGDALMFLRRDRNIYVLEPTACPFAIFEEPTGEDLQRITRCFAEDGCESPVGR